jgi:cystathionine beta-synthase
MFNDHWMVDHGFIERETHGNLRDLIGRRHLDREDYCLTPEIPLSQVIKRMAMYSVSQMVVMENDRVAGIIDETDVLMAMVHDRDNKNRPVSDFMTRRLETLSPNASVNDLIPIFRADRVAIVMDENNYYGLITKIDLINFLKKQLP